MRASKLSAALIVMALLLSALPVSGLTDEERAGGWSGLLPKGIGVGLAPTVGIVNVTVPTSPVEMTSKELALTATAPSDLDMTNLSLTLDIYRFALLGVEEDLDPSYGMKRPWFEVDHNNTTAYVENVTLSNGSLPKGSSWVVRPTVAVPEDARLGFYRVRLSLEYDALVDDRTVGRVARSRGHFTDAQWSELLGAARGGHDFTTPVAGVNGLLPEAGFTVAPPLFDYLSRPNRVPDFGNFTTPVIRPGGSGTYNFTISNRYDANMTDVRLEVSLYMWATLEESKAIGDLKGPKPKFDDGATTTVIELGTIAKGGSAPVALDIHTGDDTPKGTYFVRHRLTFKYLGEEYVMSSRGYFTTPQWEGFDYGNLYYQLNVSGIVPDSSISVKDPVPLWPLALLVGLCVLFGALAVVFYLAEEHGSEYPRLKKALQYWTGKLEQRRRLVQQRLDELRREVDVPLDDDEP